MEVEMHPTSKLLPASSRHAEDSRGSRLAHVRFGIERIEFCRKAQRHVKQGYLTHAPAKFTPVACLALKGPHDGVPPLQEGRSDVVDTGRPKTAGCRHRPIWDRENRALPRSTRLISQKVFIKSFGKFQFPHKSVNESFVIANVNNELTDSCWN